MDSVKDSQIVNSIKAELNSMNYDFSQDNIDKLLNKLKRPRNNYNNYH